MCENTSIFIWQQRIALRRSASLNDLGGESHPLPNSPHAELKQLEERIEQGAGMCENTSVFYWLRKLEGKKCTMN